MFHDPIHFAVFIIISLLIPILMYTSCILQALYNTLKEAYIDVIYTTPSLYWIMYDGLFFSSYFHVGEMNLIQKTKSSLVMSGVSLCDRGANVRTSFSQLDSDCCPFCEVKLAI